MDQLLERSRRMANRLFVREELSIPVDIKELIKKYAELEEANIPFGGDAICIYKENETLIVYGTEHIETRLRFTLAHELGHILIPGHTGMISCHIDEVQEIDVNEYQNMEKQANVFASELLMPTNWLFDMVKKYEALGLEFLINQICKNAEVSFPAALYALINVLPKGYIVFIDRYAQGYSQKLTSNDTEIPFFYRRSSYNMNWLELNSLKFGLIRRENEDISWYKLEGKLSTSDVESLLLPDNGKIDLTRFFTYVFDSLNEKPALILPIIIRSLPTGYIIRVTMPGVEDSIVMKSNNTFIQPKEHHSNEYEIAKWYDNYSINKGVYHNIKYIVSWWQFEISNQINSNLAYEGDSKTILRDIIERNYHSDKKKSMFAKVNGVIGSLNNRRLELDSNEFYSILKQKFLGREDIEDIINDCDFDKFLAKKTQELYNK